MDGTEQLLDQEVSAVKEGKAPCWSLRGCHGQTGLTGPMEEECPHSRSDCYSPCPEDCHYTHCMRPWHKQATDFNLILDDTVERRAANKKACYSCEFFLKHGPRVGDIDESEFSVVPDTATNDSSSDVTIHLF